MKRFFFFLFAAGLTGLAATSGDTASSQPVFVSDSLDVYIPREMKMWDLPGLAIAVVKDGKVIVSKGYGETETGSGKMVNDESLFQIASCSKAFTATSLALLDQQKKLSLDDSVVKWIPSFRLYDPLATKQLTIRDLLCHRIGLETFQGDFANWASDFSRADIIAQLAKQKPVYGLRAHFGYSNAAFLTAGEIIPRCTGTSWDDFVKKNFFDPLQMKRTSTTWNTITSDANACKPYTRWNGKEMITAYDNVDNLGPAASVISCVKDLSHWVMMQLDSGRYNKKEIVPFSVLQETRKPETIIPYNSSLFPGTHFEAYGLGWFMSDYYGKKVLWHNGGTSGFLSCVCFVPELDLGFVILTNSDNNSLFSALRYQLLDAYTGQEYRNYSAIFHQSFARAVEKSDQEHEDWRKKADAAPALPLDVKAFAGIYLNPVYGRMIVTTQDGKLGASFQHHPKMFAKLEYMGDSTFLCTFNSPLWGIQKAPFVIKDGKVDHITISVSPDVDMMPYDFRRLHQ